MSSPFSTFTDKEKEKTSRSKLEGKEKKKNIEGFAMWSGITLALIIGYIGIGANFKALSFIEPESWLATDKDFVNSFGETDGGVCGENTNTTSGGAPVPPDPLFDATRNRATTTTEQPSAQPATEYKLKLKSIAKSMARYSNILPSGGSRDFDNSSFGRPSSSDYDKYLACKNNVVNNGIYNDITQINELTKYIKIGLSLIVGHAFPMEGIVRDKNTGKNGQRYGDNTDTVTPFYRLFAQIWNQTLIVRQYVKSNAILKGMLAHDPKSEQGIKGGDGTTEHILKTVSEGFKFFNDNITSYFEKDLIILLWPLIFVFAIITSIIQPFILLFDAMRDIFFNKNPTGGVSIGQEDIFNTDNAAYWSGDGFWKLRMYTEATSGNTSIGNIDIIWKLLWNSIYLLFTFIFWFIVAIIVSIKNFVFSIIDVLEKTFFFILPFSWMNYKMQTDVSGQKDVSGFTKMSEFFIKNLKVGILAWLFILVILAFSYLGNEFAVGGIIGLLSILAYLIGTQTGILKYLQILLGTGKSKEPDDGKSVFNSILDLFSQKPFFTTFVITFIAGITTTLVLLTNYLAF